MGKYKQLIAGIIIGAVLFNAIPALAETVEILFNSINVTVNGQKVEAENILHNGRTYVPLAEIAKMLDKEVGWDDATRTASINDKGYAMVNEFIQPGSPTMQPPKGDPQVKIYEVGENAAYKITYEKVNTFYSQLGDVYAQVIVEVENAGEKTLELNGNASSFDLENKEGKFVATSKAFIGTALKIIEPGEKGYFFELVKIDTLNSLEELILIMRPSVRVSKEMDIRLSVSELEIYKNQMLLGFSIKGRVQNTTNDTIKTTRIDIVYFDKLGEPIAVASTYIRDELIPGDKAGFDVNTDLMPNGISIDSIGSYSIRAYKN